MQVAFGAEKKSESLACTSLESGVLQSSQKPESKPSRSWHSIDRNADEPAVAFNNADERTATTMTLMILFLCVALLYITH